MTVSAIETSRLRLVAPDARCLEHLLNGEDREAAEALGIALPAGLGASSEGLFRIRLADLRAAPAAQSWLLRLLAERNPPHRFIGFAGFHGPPDASGRVEVGYEVLPEHQRRGYALEAARGLLAWARDQGAMGFRAAIAVDNAASLGLADALGFQSVGSRWDALNGTEMLLELRADRLRTAAGDAKMDGHAGGGDG